MTNAISISPRQVRAARAILGWSQQDLARHAGVGVSTVADFERGQRVPVSSNLEAIRSALVGAGVALLDGGAVEGRPPAVGAPAIADGSPIRWVDETDLQHWADRRDGQDTLPELVSGLIRADVGLGVDVRFPSGDSVQRSGWDGVCRGGVAGSPFVPAGDSGWEIGAQRSGIWGKASEDFASRSAEPLELEPSRSTFVFVAPRPLTAKAKTKWIAERRAEQRGWADIRVLDVIDLVRWLELHPDIAYWLAGLIGKRPEGLQQLEEAWQEWSLSTQPPMSPELVLAGRDEPAAAVLQWLYGPPCVHAIEADSSGEAIAFLYAAIAELPAPYSAYFRSRCLIASSAEAARTLAGGPSPLVIVLEGADPGLAARVVERGHHVFAPFGSAIWAPPDVTRLPRPPRDAFESALRDMGLEREQAERLTRGAARSVTVLRRLIPSAPGYTGSVWATPEHARELLGVLLAGAWDGAQEGDRATIERLSEEKYSLTEARLTEWLGKPDSPIRKAGSAWKVTSPVDAWFQLAPYLTSTDLERFTNVALDVLGALDPRYEMPSQERWLAPIHGRMPPYSGLIRVGLAETLILLGVFGDRIRVEADAQARTSAIVRKLLRGADGRRWWSLSRLLQMLAEAAPDAFLEAVEDSIVRAGAPVMEIFREDQGLIGGAHHSELLWGLEVLAWSPSYLGRVAEILAKMDEIDPARLDPGSSRYANRPAASLRHIFSLWLPQTHAPLAARLRVVVRLRRAYPPAAWRLMLGLLPTTHDIGMYNPQPRWRDFTGRKVEAVTTTAIVEGARAVSQALLEDVGTDATRWKNLMERLPDLPPDLHREAIQRLAAAAARMTDPRARADLWAALRDLLHDHREFPDADWSLPSEELDHIEQVYRSLEPSDPIDRARWLFVAGTPKLAQPTGRGWEADAAAAAELRRHVVRQLLATSGPDALFTLADRVEAPGWIGEAVVDAVADAAELDAILVRALHAGDIARAALAHGMIITLHHRHGDAWADRLIARAKEEQWSPEVILRILHALPASRPMWERAASFGRALEDRYWQTINSYELLSSRDERAFVVTQLLAVERGRHAVHFLGHELDGVPSELLVRTLTGAAREPWSQGPAHNELAMFRYAVEKILQRLDQAGDVSEEEIARLEWAYLPLLRFSHRPPIVLHRTMARNPEFFRDVVSSVYPPAPESGVTDTPGTDDQTRRAISVQAADLLRSWDQVPGASGSVVDGAAIEAWVNRARQLCTEAGRAAAGDYHIGRVLAHAQAGPDEVWPPAAVRDVIQIVRSRDLEGGVLAGLHEKRGVTTRAFGDGGAQERALAQRYRDWAQAMTLEWPRAAALLEDIAASFEAEARRHDEDAERIDWSI